MKINDNYKTVYKPWKNIKKTKTIKYGCLRTYYSQGSKLY